MEIMETGPKALPPVRFFVILTIPFFLIIAYTSYKFYFHHNIDGDTPAYIEIALKYKNGDFLKAINGYWAPLYSWLLSPLLYFKEDPDKLLSFINVAAAILILFQLLLIINSLSLKYYLNILLQVSFAFSLGFFCFIHTTPDLLNLLFLVLYLKSYLKNSLFKNPFTTGLTGALLYLSKYYTFWFFLVHLSITFLLEKFILNQSVFKAYFKSIGTFAIISSIWISCLFIKYDHLMISYSGAYNHSITESGTIMHTWDKNGLLSPAPGNYSPWEDIALSYHFKDWSPFKDLSSFVTQLKVIKDNFLYFFRFMNANTRYGFYINFFIIGYILFKKKKINHIVNDINFKLISFGLIFVSGYILLLLCNDRYIWILYLLSTLSIVYFLNERLKNRKDLWIHLISTLVLLYCLNKKTFDQIKQKGIQDFDSYPANIALLKQTFKPSQHIASYEPFTAGHFPIDTRCSYYGNSLGYGADSVSFFKDLKKYKINFLIYSDTLEQSPPEYFLKFRRVEKDFNHLTVLEVKENTLDSILNHISITR